MHSLSRSMDIAWLPFSSSSTSSSSYPSPPLLLPRHRSGGLPRCRQGMPVLPLLDRKHHYIQNKASNRCLICWSVARIPADAEHSLLSSVALSSFLACHDKRKSNDSLCICACVCDMRAVSVSNSLCQHLHLSFHLHQHTVLQSHHLQEKEESPAAKHQPHEQIWLLWRSLSWFSFVILVTLYFSVAKKWKHSPAADKAVALLSSFCSSSCGKAQILYNQALGQGRYCTVYFPYKSTYCVHRCIQCTRTHNNTNRSLSVQWNTIWITLINNMKWGVTAVW